MKNFDEFSNGIKLNESEIRFLNEEETALADLGSDITNYLEDHDIKASYEVEGNDICIEVGGEEYKIKKDGTGFVLSTKHNQDEKFKDQDALISWWASFVPQHKHAEHEYRTGDGIIVGESVNEIPDKIKRIFPSELTDQFVVVDVKSPNTHGHYQMNIKRNGKDGKDLADEIEKYSLKQSKVYSGTTGDEIYITIED